MSSWVLPFPDNCITCAHGVTDDLHPNGHRGTDYGKREAKLGAPVKAIALGRVVLSEYHHNLGNVVVVKHATGKFSYYCHLKDAGPAVGTYLRAAGEVIGKVGNTGQYSFGAHLHCGVSDERTGVYAGKVYDIVKYVKEQQALEKKAAPKAAAAPAEAAPAAAPAPAKKSVTPKAKAE